MKVLIVFAICILAVFGDEEKPLDEIDEKLKDYRKECLLELNLDPRLINDDKNATRPSPQEATCYQACLDKKLGLMNEDGTYNLERMKALAKSPEGVKEVEEIYNNKMKNCQAEVGNDVCKMAACSHSMPEEMWKKKE